MLAYPVDEAETLLSGRLSTATTSLENCEEDLEFLREQITVRGRWFWSRLLMLTLRARRWRLRSPESTTGMLYKNERKRGRMTANQRERTMTSLMVETF